MRYSTYTPSFSAGWLAQWARYRLAVSPPTPVGYRWCATVGDRKHEVRLLHYHIVRMQAQQVKLREIERDATTFHHSTFRPANNLLSHTVSFYNLSSYKRFATTFHPTACHTPKGVLLLYISCYKQSASTFQLTIFHPTNGVLHFLLLTVCSYISSYHLSSFKRFATTFHPATFHPHNCLLLCFILPPCILQTVFTRFHAIIFHPTNELLPHFILQPFILQMFCYYISFYYLSAYNFSSQKRLIPQILI